MNSGSDITNQLCDASARQQALDPTQSFIVSAPAGSGKTGLITQRVLQLLRFVDNPEEILCITFTRKAAAEMRHRVHSALIDASQNPCPSDSFKAQTWQLATQALSRNKELGWDLLDIPYRLRIKTIDSFCHYIAKQFMFDGPFGELPEQSEFPDHFYHIAARELLQKLEQDNDVGRALAVIVAHMGNDLSRCERLFAEMLGKRDQWLPHIFTAADNRDYFQIVIEQLITVTLEQMERQLFPLAGELLELADYAGNHAPNGNTALASLKGITELPTIDRQGLGQWKNLLRMLVKKDKDFSPRKAVTKRDGFPADNKKIKGRMENLLADYRQDSILQALLLDVMHLPEAELSHDQQQILNALALLLPRLTALLKTIFQQQGQSDYSEITMAALQALQQSPEQDEISDITLRLDYQIKHILVDEFQDTSGSQMKLLEHLVDGWQADDGRTLFLVGDAMQSLYSFRDARVGLFINAQTHPIGPVQCNPLSLTSNFRSQQAIVDWVNQNFAAAFPQIANINRGAVPYNYSTAVKEAIDNTPVSFNGFSCEAPEQYELEEANRVATLCQEIKQQDPDQSIAILVRYRSHLKAIVPALIKADLCWEAIDIDPLADRMPVVDLMSLTRAILSPADRIAWLAVLRAPFCGLCLQDLVILTNGSPSSKSQPACLLEMLYRLQQDKTGFQQLTANGQRILTRIAPILTTAWQQRQADNLRNLIEQLWINLGGPATLIEQRDIFDCRHYLDLLEQWQIAGDLKDWNQFVRAVDDLYALPMENSDKTQSNAIQVMTIHKAKGLEFDHVIVPSLSKASRADNNPLLRWQEQVDEHNHSSLLLAALGPHDDDNDPVYRYLQYEQSARSQLENTRVLYVAATRAIKKLHLFAKLKASGEGWQKPTKTSLLSPIWPSLQKELQAQCYQVTELDDTAVIDTIQTTASNYYRRLPDDFVAVTMPTAMMTLGVAGKGTSTTTAEPIEARPRHLGTALHRTLKQIATEGLENWPKQRLLQLPQAWRATLVQMGLLATENEIKSLQNAVDKMLADPQGRWILQSHPDSCCEQALAYRDQQSATIKTSVIDRTFVDKGVRWIIDYKFSQPAEGESEQSFIDRQSKLYRSQLDHYAMLYKQLENRPVRCALYFPQTSVFVEVVSN
jgi:ATP-dependent helicase/nuclease subunit A